MEFHGIAQSIAGNIFERCRSKNEDGSSTEPEKIGITVGELNEIVGNCAGKIASEFNCYPGTPSNRCFEFAMFIALASPSIAKPRGGHLSCERAMAKIVQHMMGKCMNITRYVLFITDHWDAVAADEWRIILNRISKDIRLEIYLMNGPKVSLVTI